MLALSKDASPWNCAFEKSARYGNTNPWKSIDPVAFNSKYLDIGFERLRAVFLLRYEAQGRHVECRGFDPFADFVFIEPVVCRRSSGRLLILGLLAQHAFGPGIPRLPTSPPQRNALVHACFRQ